MPRQRLDTWFDEADVTIDDTRLRKARTDEKGSRFASILKESVDSYSYRSQNFFNQRSGGNEDEDRFGLPIDTKNLLRFDKMRKANELRLEGRVTFNPLIEWEGYVIEIHEDYVTAQLKRIKGPTAENEEIAEIFFDDIQYYDRNLVKEGSVFVWSIGYTRDPKGTKRKASQIVFRRLPAWSKADLIYAENRGKALTQYFTKNEADETKLG